MGLLILTLTEREQQQLLSMLSKSHSDNIGQAQELLQMFNKIQSTVISKKEYDRQVLSNVEKPQSMKKQ